MSSSSSEDWPRGSAEYLSTRLTGPDYSCPHPHKLRAGIQSKIPKRLGLFHVSDDDLSYIDTEKLCQRCYNDVIPNGFLAWSTTYWRLHCFIPSVEVPPSIEPIDPSSSITGDRGQGVHQFPPQSQAGTELFSHKDRIEVFPKYQMPKTISGKDKVAQILGNGAYDPRPYERRRVPIPGDQSIVAWHFLHWARQPFYIDLLHLQPPWRGGLSKIEQKKEDFRVTRENGAAYLGAAGIVNAVPEGGSGLYTASEHRIAEIGSYRLVPIGTFDYHAAEGDACANETFEAHHRASGSIEISRAVSREDPTIPPTDLHLQAARRDSTTPSVYGSDSYPTKNDIDAVTKQAIGRKGRPTQDEKLRRKYAYDEEQRRKQVRTGQKPRFALRTFFRKNHPQPVTDMAVSQSIPRIIPLTWYQQQPAGHWTLHSTQGSSLPNIPSPNLNIRRIANVYDEVSTYSLVSWLNCGPITKQYTLDPDMVMKIAELVADGEVKVLPRYERWYERWVDTSGRIRGSDIIAKPPWKPVLSRDTSTETLLQVQETSTTSDILLDLIDDKALTGLKALQIEGETFEERFQLTEAELSWFTLLKSTQEKTERWVSNVLGFESRVLRGLLTQIYLLHGEWGKCDEDNEYCLGIERKLWGYFKIPDTLRLVHGQRKWFLVDRLSWNLKAILLDLETLDYFPEPAIENVQPHTIERLISELQVDVSELKSELGITCTDQNILEQLHQRTRWLSLRLDALKQSDEDYFCELLPEGLRARRPSFWDSELRQILKDSLPVMERRFERTSSVCETHRTWVNDSFFDSCGEIIEEIEEMPESEGQKQQTSRIRREILPGFLLEQLGL